MRSVLRIVMAPTLSSNKMPFTHRVVGAPPVVIAGVLIHHHCSWTPTVETQVRFHWVPPSPCSITKERTEVIFQGTLSQDPKDPAAVWEEYQFLCKPGDVYRRPCLISPYHYRLDWLMWFAAFQVLKIAPTEICAFGIFPISVLGVSWTNTQSFSVVQTSLLPHSLTVLKKTNTVKPFFSPSGDVMLVARWDCFSEFA